MAVFLARNARRLRGDRAQSKSQTMGKEMAERSWFYAAGGQQQGPVSEAQLRDLIARGTVTADTLVWSEGMAAWQRAGEVPGLFQRRGFPSGARVGRYGSDHRRL
jgi:hypothetical protein